MLRIILALIFVAVVIVASYATTVTITSTNFQANRGVLHDTYYQIASGPGSATPSTNTALTPSASSGSYVISAGTSGYLWSPQFSSATTIPSSKMTLDVWASATAPTFGLDGSAGGADTSPDFTFSLTTTTANDVIYVSVVEGDSRTVSSITSSPSLTWTRRLSVAYSTASRLETWYAVWSGSGTISITINLSGSTNVAAVAFGIRGANTASPFDSNVAVPRSATGTGTPASVSITTTGPRDFIIGALGVEGSPALTAGSCCTLILTQTITGRRTSDEYQITSAPQTDLALSYSWTGATQAWAMIADAVIAAPTLSFTIRTTDSAGTLVSTLLSSTNTNSISMSNSQTVIILSISSGSIPAGGYIEVILTAPTSTSITIFWGVAQPTNFQIPRVILSP